MRRWQFIFSLLLACHCRANYREWQSPVCTIDKPDLTILQFSDTHVRNNNDAEWLHAQLVAATGLNKPDVLVHTGDITLDGEDAEWLAFVAGIKDINPPPLYVWGNHDMALKQSQFAKGGLSHYQDIGNYRLILIDTAWEGPFTGSYTSVPESEFAALKTMADTKKKILLFAHHPLGKDAPHFRLRNADQVLGLFANAEVVGVFTGHFHGAYLAPEKNLLFAGVAPLARHQRNHTWSQTKGYRLIELQNGCLRTRFVKVET